MILTAITGAFVSILAAIFDWLPQINTIPPILGIDIDTILVNGMGMTYTYAAAVWPVALVFQGFLVLIGYYTLKMILKFFLGHRAPGQH